MSSKGMRKPYSNITLFLYEEKKGVPPHCVRFKTSFHKPTSGKNCPWTLCFCPLISLGALLTCVCSASTSLTIASLARRLLVTTSVKCFSVFVILGILYKIFCVRRMYVFTFYHLEMLSIVSITLPSHFFFQPDCFFCVLSAVPFSIFSMLAFFRF